VKRIRPLLLAFVGLCLPLGLALAVYLTSARSLAAPPPIGAVPTQIAKASPKAPTATSKAKKREDRSGNCDEAEHASDPECTGGTATSGGGSTGSDDSSGSGSSGSGSSGSGSDDSSGSGSSGSSGSGSGGSGSDSSGSGSGDD
jgi:hypothetical protein